MYISAAAAALSPLGNQRISGIRKDVKNSRAAFTAAAAAVAADVLFFPSKKVAFVCLPACLLTSAVLQNIICRAALYRFFVSFSP